MKKLIFMLLTISTLFCEEKTNTISTKILVLDFMDIFKKTDFRAAYLTRAFTKKLNKLNFTAIQTKDIARILKMKELELSGIYDIKNTNNLINIGNIVEANYIIKGTLNCQLFNDHSRLATGYILSLEVIDIKKSKVHTYLPPIIGTNILEVVANMDYAIAILTGDGNNVKKLRKNFEDMDEEIPYMLTEQQKDSFMLSSIIIPGSGQIYLNKYGLGLSILGSAIISVAVTLFGPNTNIRSLGACAYLGCIFVSAGHIQWTYNRQQEYYNSGEFLSISYSVKF